MNLVVNSGGLGSTASDVLLGTPTLTSAAWANACGDNFPSYILDFNCWGNSYSDWQAALASFSTINIPAPTAPAAPVDLTGGVPDTTGAASQDLSNAAILATQAATAAANPSVGTQQSAGLCPAWCSFADCDANCNLVFDSTTLLLFAGVAALLVIGVKLL